ncbi:ribbon-helix-helix protein, CopG family [Ruminococcus sp.]|uniref:ribbon-helix-helix protein, CopG family n=1 Tax=Ruminococcus sp. TaxID=41978 RepID=UPI003AB17D73
MSPKTGRPKIDNPKSERITVRLDKASAETLDKYCEQEKVEKAEAIRRGISKLKSDIKK